MCSCCEGSQVTRMAVECHHAVAKALAADPPTRNGASKRVCCRSSVGANLLLPRRRVEHPLLTCPTPLARVRHGV